MKYIMNALDNVFIFILCFFCIAAVLFYISPSFAQSSHVSSMGVGISLAKALTDFDYIEEGQKSISFASGFKISIKHKTGDVYKLAVVEIDDKGKEHGDKFEKDFASNIPDCNSQECVYTCTRVGIKKESDGVHINCYNKKTGKLTGDTKNNIYYSCPYSDKSVMESTIKDSVLRYGYPAANDAGIRPEIMIALIKSIMKKESSFEHCKNGLVQIGPAGSIGIMQINPQYYGIQTDIDSNIKEGVNLIKKNLVKFKGYKEQLRLAIAYYNCGGTWSKAIPEDGRGINIEWDSKFKNILKKYCSFNKGNTIDYVETIIDKYFIYYMNYPDCYRYNCELLA